MKPAEPRPQVGFGGRSSSPAANLSIRQKICSFEMFSTPAGTEKVDNRKPLSPSSPCPCPVETETTSSEEEPRQERPVSNQDTGDRETADLVPGPNDPLPAGDQEDRNPSPVQGRTDPPPPTGPRTSGAKAAIPQVDLDEDVDVDVDEELSADQPQKDLDGENLEKILSFSIQVS